MSRPPDVNAMLDELRQQVISTKTLSIGSDVEIARHLVEALRVDFGQVVHAEGKVWQFNRKCWQSIPKDDLRLRVHQFDGMQYVTPGGNVAIVKLGKPRIDSVLSELAAQLADPDFFGAPPVGINCQSGFIHFDSDGSPTLEPHDPAHRCRHVLPGAWSPDANPQPPPGSLLGHLLEGSFRGDPDAEAKAGLIAEVIGCAAAGYATRLREPKAVVYDGPSAGNGKSQMLELARGVLPPSAVATIPAGRMADERHIVGLAGKLLNAADELSSSAAIASDGFKAVVTGEPVQGRDVYRPRLEFRPIALHVFATNVLPSFSGGMDRGVQRRLMVVPFLRSIPDEERVEGIGRRVAVEEPDLLLAWAVAGASRVIRRRRFDPPASCRAALDEWIFGADPVLAWLYARTQVVAHLAERVRTASAFAAFKNWAVAEGHREQLLPAINTFVQRVRGADRGIGYLRRREGAYFLGLRIDP